jgi:nitroreductase
MSETSSPLSVKEAIASRRAVRSFLPEPIDDAKIQSLLGAAVHAPTAMHREPWAFVIVQDRAVLRRLSDRVKAHWQATEPNTERHVLAAMPESRGFLEALSRPDFNVFYDAGTLILICARPLSRFVSADCWLAAENLMLAACGMGLGTCLVGGAITALNLPDVKAELAIPADVELIAPIIVGVPRGTVAPTSRRSPEILSWVR